MSEKIFVPNGTSARETAVSLLGAAEEFGFDVRVVQVASGGFWIPSELSEKLNEEKVEKPKRGRPKKTSGSRAEKNIENETSEE